MVKGILDVKTHAEKIREAITDLGEASPKEIMAWIKSHYPEDPVNPKSYRADIIGCSINHSSQHHYPSMPKFLWFNEETKRYRLAEPHEQGKTTTPSEKKRDAEPEPLLIDGVPIAKLSVTGQVLIPKIIREQMGLQPGDNLALLYHDGVLELKKARITIQY
jgi:AbrB family looped-hinge helix DNA binding protein